MASTENQDSAAMAQQQQQQSQQQSAQPAQATQGAQQVAPTAAQPQQIQPQPHPQQQQQSQPPQQQQQQQLQQPQQNIAQVPSPQQQPPQQIIASAPATAQQAAAVAAAASQVPIAAQDPNNPANQPQSDLACQWTGCREICPTPEALYEHVCERHVGRKSTNNLNLTCSWGNCRTTTVKRDHITSHIRVHVPLKPHKCDFCGKAFKRPQDLKKHVKTHADDSVLVRSPEPGPGTRPPNGMFGVGPDGKPARNPYMPAGHYFDSSMGPVPGAPYGHGPPQYYHPPHPQHPQHPQHPSNPSYGNVYYAVGSDAAHQASYESKKRGYDALNEFFGDLKRRQFDPTSYAAVGQRLLNLHGLPLPLVHAAAMPEYQPMPAMVAVGGHGGYHPGPIPAQPYHLPPMGNARTKTDLMNIDQYLEQMQTTVYESDEHVSAAGVAQPGAHFVHGALSYRTTNSPPTATQLPSSHATSAASAPPATSASARSPHSATPALTPPSSAQSYTSGRSPVSMSSNHHLPATPQHHSQVSSSMYPTLPTTTAHESASAAGYPTVSSGAPASTLSSIFENDDRRRYTGGMLQRARPEYPDSMEVSYDNQTNNTSNDSKELEEDKVSDSMIDPFLRHASGDQHNSASSNDGASTVKGEGEGESRKPSFAETLRRLSNSRTAEEIWVDHVRVLQRLREYIHDRLYHGDYEEDAAGHQHGGYAHHHGFNQSEMEGMEAIAAAANADRAQEQEQEEEEEEESKPGNGNGGNEGEGRTETESLYPVLKMDEGGGEGGDEDEKMKMDES